jgi:hypothetical protein
MGVSHSPRSSAVPGGRSKIANAFRPRSTGVRAAAFRFSGMKRPVFRRLAPALAAALLSACIIDDFKGGEAAPELAYAETYLDTVGVEVSHAPVVGGGPVRHFRIQPALPEGLAFDTVTGAVRGTPLEAAPLEEYRVIATGPGGFDTAYFPLEVVDTASSSAQATVAVALTLKASAGFTLSRLILEYASSANAPADAVVRDTIPAGLNGFAAASASDQSVLKLVLLEPLRDWTIRARVLDVRDSVIYRDSTRVNALMVGETRAASLDLQPRYLRYFAKFMFPDSLRASGTSLAQALNVRRVQVLLNDVAVADSTRVRFAPGAPSHALAIPYVPAGGSQTFKMRVYADLPGWPAGSPVFSDSRTLAPAGDTSYVLTAPWTGPGSPSDPNYNPSNPGGPITPLTWTLGASGGVTFEPGLDTTLFKKK